MERCTCGGSGYVVKGGVQVPCICKVLKIYNTYLSPFKDGRPPTDLEKNLVLHALAYHKSKEDQYAAKIAKQTGKDDIIPITLPKHWFLIDGGFPFGSAGQPHDFHMPFFFEYLVRTKEYVNYRIFDTVTLQNIYYEYDGGDDRIASPDSAGTGFYGFAAQTFILKITDVLPGKEGLNILRHFITTYKDRNILIYADEMYRKTPTIRKWDAKVGKYELKELVGEKSLLDILAQEFGSTFVNLEDILVTRSKDKLRKKVHR